MLRPWAVIIWCHNMTAMLIISLKTVLFYFRSHALLCCQKCMPAKQMCVNQLLWDEGFLPGKELMKSSCLSRKSWKIVLFWWLFAVLALRIAVLALRIPDCRGRGGPRVSHRSLRAHSALSPSAFLFWLGDCNPTRSASIHGLYVSLSLCCRPAGLKGKRGKHGGDLQVIFLPSPFKSTLRHAPLWPLMLLVHLAKRRGETQAHRNGQKQFHPLSESISTRHSEGKKTEISYVPRCLKH